MIHDRELQQLNRAFGKAKAQEGGTVLVTGSYGMGKTFLVDRFIQSLSSSRVTILKAAPALGEESQSISFTDMITGYLLQTGLSPRRLAGLLAPSDLTILAHFHPHFDHFSRRETPDSISGDDITRMVMSVVRSISRIRPVCLIIDDLHKRHPSDQQRFFHVSRSVTLDAVLLLGTLEPGPHHGSINRSVTELQSRGEIEILELTELSREDTGVIIARVTGFAVSAPVRDFIHDISGGNPMFVREFVTAYVQNGLFQSGRMPGKRDMQAVFNMARCPSLEHMISRKLQSVPGETRRILQDAACLGPEFHIDMLKQISAATTDQLITALACFCDLDILSKRAPQIYRFSHALIPSKILKAMEPTARLSLTTRVVDLPAHGYGSGWTKQRLRHMAYLGEQNAQGLLLKDVYDAARCAESLFDMETARRLYTVAENLSADRPADPLHVKALVRSLRLERTLSIRREIIPRLEHALEDISSAVFPREVMDICYDLAVCRLKFNDYHGALAALDTIETLRNDIHDYAQIQLQVAFLAFHIHYRQGNASQADAILKSLETLIHPTAHARQFWQLAGIRCGLAIDTGDFTHVWKYITQMEQAAHRTGDPYLKFQGDILRGTVETETGLLEDGEQHLRDAVRYFWSCGIQRFCEDAGVRLAANLIAQGRFSHAREVLSTIDGALVTPAQILARGLLARIHNDSEDFAAAYAEVSRAVQGEEIPFLYGADQLILEKARALTGLGRASQAQSLLKGIEDRLREYGDSELFFGLTALCSAYACSGSVNKCLSTFNQVSYTIVRNHQLPRSKITGMRLSASMPETDA